MKDLKKFATLEVALTKFTKTNKTFSLGRARIFYIGPNANRTIITEDVAEQLIATIAGTPVVGEYDGATGDFKGHEENQVAYGFVPLEPRAKKVTVIEDVMGIPVARTYYEVDVVIWDGRFPEAAKILGEEKSLSMELNPETVQGEFEVYEEKVYLRFTSAEFIGITILGDEHTPCFKDAKFLSLYTSMLSEYSIYAKGQQSENNIGGTEMSVIEEVASEISGIVDSVNEEITNTNEEEVVATEEVVAEVLETEEAEVSEVAEEVAAIEEVAVAEEVAPEITAEEFEETEKTIEDSEITDEVVEETEETEQVEEVEETAEEVTEEEVAEEVIASEEDSPKESVDALYAKIEDLESRLSVYEKKEKAELIATFSKKIRNTNFIEELSESIDALSIDELKSALSQELANQVLAEETEEDSKSSFSYSYVNLLRGKSGSDWTDAVRNHKNSKN